MKPGKSKYYIVCLLILGLGISSTTWAGTSRKDLEKEHDARRKAFVKNVKTVLVAPIAGAHNLKREDLRAIVDKALAKRFAKYNIQVIPSDTYHKLQKEKVQELGGIYDRITGEIIEEKAEALRSYIRAGIQKEHSYDAVLLPTLKIREITHRNGKAKWDGVSRKIFKPGGRGFLNPGAAPQSGEIGAASLHIRIEKPDGSLFYSGESGWILLQKYSKQGLEPILPEKLFSNQKHNQEAVENLLNQLLKRFAILHPKM